MARIPLNKKKMVLSSVVIYYQMMTLIMEMMIMMMHYVTSTRTRMPKPIYYRLDGSARKRQEVRNLNISSLIQMSDQLCMDHLRMDRRTFFKLCDMLRGVGGLKGNRNTDVEEMVAIFLYTLSHDTKNRRTQLFFRRSGETISRHFNTVLHAVLKCHHLLWKKPEPIDESCVDERWKWFKNCLGALDGTHIKVRVGEKDKVRYRNRKGDLSTNVLGVCSKDMLFVYVLPRWEGSAHDNRVLRDALSRRNGLKVPKGSYYLCDAGYMNCQGFLTPYRGQRYHLNEWRNGYQPTTTKEFYNMKHCQARNVIERCFGLLKIRWGILRCTTWYSVKTVGMIVSACALLHNFIRMNMVFDPIETTLECDQGVQDIGDEVLIEHLETSTAWNNIRDNLANEMFQRWQESRGT